MSVQQVHEKGLNVTDETAAEFIRAIEAMSVIVHANAANKGFWDEDRGDAESIALMHSELSEALESVRRGHPPDHHCPEFTSTEVEFADLLIRLMDTSHKRGYRIAQAAIAKHRFNLSRPHKHGKAF